VAQSTSDADRWLALILRCACSPAFSFKYWAIGSPSIRTIEKRLRLADAMLSHDELEALALRNLTIMMKAAGKLGLKNITV
jgi:hypothetical protein